VLEILRYPDPRLHKVAKPVDDVDARIRRLVDDMLATMYAAEGIGLAATQVDVHERVVVIDTSEAHDRPLVLINPEIVWRSPEMTLGEEGCLSVPANASCMSNPRGGRAAAQPGLRPGAAAPAVLRASSSPS
jgi:peptide deformylase